LATNFRGGNSNFGEEFPPPAKKNQARINPWYLSENHCFSVYTALKASYKADFMAVLNERWSIIGSQSWWT